MHLQRQKNGTFLPYFNGLTFGGVINWGTSVQTTRKDIESRVNKAQKGAKTADSPSFYLVEGAEPFHGQVVAALKTLQ